MHPHGIVFYLSTELFTVIHKIVNCEKSPVHSFDSEANPTLVHLKYTQKIVNICE